MHRSGLAQCAWRARPPITGRRRLPRRCFQRSHGAGRASRWYLAVPRAHSSLALHHRVTFSVLAVGPGPRLRGAQKRDWPHLFRLSQQSRVSRFTFTVPKPHRPLTCAFPLSICCISYCSLHPAASISALPIVVLRGLSWAQTSRKSCAQPFFLIRPIAVDASSAAASSALVH